MKIAVAVDERHRRGGARKRPGAVGAGGGSGEGGAVARLAKRAVMRHGGEMLNGIWVPQTAEFSGQAIPLPPTRWIIADGGYVVEAEAGRDEGILVVDTSATPHAVDIVGQAGPNAGKTLRAIFRIRGDLLQLCYEVGDAPARPTAFVSEQGSMALTVRYRRVQ